MALSLANHMVGINGGNVKLEMNPQAKRKFFEDYEAADKEVNEAKAVYDAALTKRSECVKSIMQSCGKGPFNFRGGVKIIVRGNTYFFRSVETNFQDIG